ncbi:MAG: NfeD family protein [Desulfotignum sp.]
MNAYVMPVLLQVLGVAVILVEIFVPSLGLLTVLAGGIFFYSLYLVFTTISREAGILFVVADLVLVPIVLYFGLKALGKSSLSLHKQLSRKEGVASQKPGLTDWIHKTGVAVTDLRPSGTALIEGKRLDVVTNGDYVDAGTRIRVTGVAGNRIVVDMIE